MNIKLILNKLEKLILLLIAILFTIMVVSLFLQIILRFIFKSANTWSEELTRYTFAWMVMLGSSVALRRSRHMNVDYFIRRIPENVGKINFIIINLLIIVFLLAIIIHGIELVSLTHKQLSPGMRIPMSYAYLAMPVGGILMLLFTIELFFTNLRNKKYFKKEE
ncbi:MAG TPA: TRAP transporter small permease [Tissierellia bacterium]|nr:TRAP transporter small permease [Tissierellia bacterium]